MRGRKPKTPELKRLQGNPGHRLIPNGAKPVPGKLLCPDYLTGTAREVWQSVIEEMSAAGTLGIENIRIIERYSVLYARWREAEAHVAEHGVVVPAPRSEVPMPNPYLSVANGANDRLARLEAELGLTPSSRARVGQSLSSHLRGNIHSGSLEESPWVKLRALQAGSLSV